MVGLSWSFELKNLSYTSFDQKVKNTIPSLTIIWIRNP
jgi:hypothetical protein